MGKREENCEILTFQITIIAVVSIFIIALFTSVIDEMQVTYNKSVFDKEKEMKGEIYKLHLSISDNLNLVFIKHRGISVGNNLTIAESNIERFNNITKELNVLNDLIVSMKE